MSIDINGIKITVFNDHINPATYWISYRDQKMDIRQSDMELFVATLKVLINQNKEGSSCPDCGSTWCK